MGPLQPGPGPGKVVPYFPFFIHKHGKHTGPLVEQPTCAFELKSYPVISAGCWRSTVAQDSSMSILVSPASDRPCLRPSAPSSLPPSRAVPPSLGLSSHDGGPPWGDGFADAAPRLVAQRTSWLSAAAAAVGRHITIHASHHDK